jgi:23S rRNA (guanosine2251-2'-O)-methyltransferase
MKPSRGRSSSSKNIPYSSRRSTDDGLFKIEGLGVIRDYLKFRPSSVKRIFCLDRVEKETRPSLKEHEKKLEIVDSGTRSKDSHESVTSPVWADIKLELLHWHDFEDSMKTLYSKQGTVLVLDHVSDPRNLGAIVRSAAFFGIRHVIVPERRQVLLAQAAVSTAQAGFALCDLVVVVNVARTIEQLKEMGFWTIGAAMDGQPVVKLQGKFEKQALVLGSEDKGISQNVLSKCDVTACIVGVPQTIDSLNVSVAAGILLDRLTTR